MCGTTGDGSRLHSVTSLIPGLSGLQATISSGLHLRKLRCRVLGSQSGTDITHNEMTVSVPKLGCGHLAFPTVSSEAPWIHAVVMDDRT